MTPHTCHDCAGQGRWLEHLSKDALVNYYRCECGSVWTIWKDETRPRQVVTTRASVSPIAA